MALENTRSFTKIVAGKKVVLPRFAELPYDCLEALSVIEEASRQPQGLTLTTTARSMGVFKELVPGFADITKWASTTQVTNLLADWIRYEEVAVASDNLAKK